MNLVGLKFGSALVLKQFPRDGKPDGVLIKCDCGAEKETCSRSVRRGRTKSCGCLQRAKATKHGVSSHPEYSRWNGMVQRCTNPDWINYAKYGGRGISVCDTWLRDPQAFFTWLEKSGCKEGLQVDRIDNDLGYSPDNCRLVSVSANSRNRKSNRMITVAGREMSIAEAADLYGVPYDRAYQRITKLGWTPERAVGI